MEIIKPPDIKDIKLPPDKELIKSLRRKLEEYQDRLKLKPYQAPELNFGTHFKILILEHLLQHEQVSYNERLCAALNKYGSDPVVKKIFHNAFEVTRCYVTGELDKLIGGTGLH